MFGHYRRPKLIPAKVRDVARFPRPCQAYDQIDMFVEICQSSGLCRKYKNVRFDRSETLGSLYEPKNKKTKRH